MFYFICMHSIACDSNIWEKLNCLALLKLEMELDLKTTFLQRCRSSLDYKSKCHFCMIGLPNQDLLHFFKEDLLYFVSSLTLYLKRYRLKKFGKSKK